MRKFVRFINLLMVFALLVFAAWPNRFQAANAYSAMDATQQVRQPVSDPLSIALAYVQEHKSDYGLSLDDLIEYRVTDMYASYPSGVTHVYLRQQHAGIDVFNSNININILPDGQVLSMWSTFEPGVAARVNSTQPTITPEQAVQSAAAALDLPLTEPLTRLVTSAGPARAVTLSSGGISLEPIPAQLVFYASEGKELRLAWDISIYQLDSQHWWSLRMDAETGKLLAQGDFVDNESYTVYPMPVESPNHTSPLPPADARVNVNNPYYATASPFGWHDTNGAAGAEFTTTQGNNAHAYTDLDANNSPDAGSSPDGGAGLNFNFSIDLTQPPSAYRPAAVTNLFYWNNIIHDVLYMYGFDEAAGNFQENNYGNGGLGSDYVQAEAQDGSGTNNANFATPADGSNPRMQMYVGTNPDPDVDGDLDNMVIVHEYGHGVSNRLTGGPSNVLCLENEEQMGEGWSDFLGLVMTHRSTDTANTPRGVGTYLFGYAPNGVGIRPAPYTRDMSVNAYTYADLGGVVAPHGVGFVWSTMLWDMYWDLVDQYGYNPNLYGAWNSGGNNLALQLVMDGMKLQPCSPGFVDGRNAILQADVALTGGTNQCTIWEAFARRGLGYSASQGSNDDTTDGTAAYDLPISCQSATVIVTPASQNICVADSAQYQVTANELFTAPLTFSGSGNPAPSTLAFNPNPDASAPFSSVLTVGNTAAAAAGNYELTISATDAFTTAFTTVDLNLFAGAPLTPDLTAPADDAAQVSVMPELQWAAAGNTITYTVEIATDEDFNNIVYSADTLAITHQVDALLEGGTLYFWRVTGHNPCGPGSSSAAFSFYTELVFCVAPDLAILDNNPTGVTSSQTLPNLGTIADLNLWVKATHSWVGDTRFILSHTDLGTSVTAIDRPGVPASLYGCGLNDIDLTLDDEGVNGPVENMCGPASPALFGSPTPNNPLSAFDGQSTAGQWSLNVADFVAPDAGTLQQWCIEFQVSAADLEISNSVSPVGYAGPGQPITYTLNFSNVGDVIASSVVITNEVPGDLTGVSFVSSGAAVIDTGASPAYIWSVEDLSPGESGTITITGVVDAGAVGAYTLQSQASIGGSGTDSTPGNNQSSASNMVDAVAPDTAFITTPDDLTSDNTPSFTFNGSDAHSGLGYFECSLDGSAFGTCASPHDPGALSDGEHTFDVRSVDNVENADDTPSSFTWTIDTTAPGVPILVAPAANGLLNPNAANALTWNSVPGADGYRLNLDGSGIDMGLDTSYELPPMLTGSTHTWSVAAYDALGNTSAFSDTWDFVIAYIVMIPFTLR